MMAVKKTDKPAVFSKAQILESAAFNNRKDILNVLIDDNETITLSEVKDRLDKFMKGKVN